MSGTIIIDRRLNSKGKSIPNRDRFIKRVEGQIKKALPNIINNNSIKDITDGKGTVKVPIKGIEEPSFTYDRKTGNKKYIHHGNKKYIEGDSIPKPEGDGGKGRKGSNDPSTQDDEFTISISKDEFLDFFFKELELPDLIKKHLSQVTEWTRKRAGFVTEGVPSRLNVVQSFKNSLMRKIAIGALYDKKIKEIEAKLAEEQTEENRILLEKDLDKYKKLKLTMPYMDDIDLKYNHFDIQPNPSFSAVVFMVMDISGSMTEHHKDLAKRFFILLYLFLTKEYEKVDIVYVRHHTQASEVDEKEFFESRESGGTMVAPALKLIKKIKADRYDKNWNSYIAQISDGDTWDISDSEESKALFSELLTEMQWGWYIEVRNREDMELGDLYRAYKGINNKNFTISRLYQHNEIWPLFQELFSKKTVKI